MFLDMPCQVGVKTREEQGLGSPNHVASPLLAAANRNTAGGDFPGMGGKGGGAVVGGAPKGGSPF